MALPAELGLVRLTGTFVDLAGTPIVGRLRFEAKVPVLLAATANHVIVPVVRQVTLDANGSFSIDLPATDDPDIRPSESWTYQVTEVWPGGRTYRIELPVGSGTLDLADISPVSAPADVVYRLGPPGPAGNPGPSAQSGYFSAPTIGADYFSVQIISGWGVRDDGTAYYDPEGADPEHAAILGWNARGQLTLRRIDGESDPTVTSDIFDATSDGEMTALMAKKGDRVRRIDRDRMYVLRAEPASELANWIAELVPPSAVVRPTRREVTADLTLALTDENTVIENTAGTPVTITVPPSSEVPWPNYTRLWVGQVGAGAVTLAAGIGVTLRAKDNNYSTRGPHTRLLLHRLDGDIWNVTGDNLDAVTTEVRAATNANTVSTLVRRNASGDFDARYVNLSGTNPSTGAAVRRDWVENRLPPSAMGMLVGATGATQSIAHNTSTILNLNAVNYAFGVTATTSTGRINITKSGIYLVSGQVQFSITSTAGAVSGSRHLAYIARNGVLQQRSQGRSDPGTMSTHAIATAAIPLILSAGDYVQLGIRQESTVARVVALANSFLQVTLLSADVPSGATADEEPA